MKRQFVICICIVMAILFTGAVFAGNQQKPKDTGSIKFTMFDTDLNPDEDNFQSEVARKISEITGVELEIERPVGDAQQKNALILASGDYPDFLYVKGDVTKFVEAGALLDLTDLIEKYGPNIKKIYGQYLKRHRFSPADPGIYWLGCFGIDSVTFEPGGGHQVQLAVLKEMGYPRIKTVTEFENVIKAYAAKYPTINGKPTIPYTLCAEGWRILISITNAAVFATGGNGDDGEWYIDQNTLKAVLHHTRPEEKEYFRWLNHMYAAGLLDPEFATQKYDTYVEKIASGRVLGLSTAWWEIAGTEDVLTQGGMSERRYGFFPVTLNDKLEYKSYMSGGYVPNQGVSISKSCKDPVRAIKFLDWMCTDEAQVLKFWGIEGKHYVVKNGKRVETDEFKKMKETDPDYKRKTGVGLYVYPWPQRGAGLMDPTGNPYDKNSSIQMIRDLYPDIEKQVLDAYGFKTNWGELYKTEYPVKKYGNAWQVNYPSDGIIAELFNKCQQINWKWVLEAIICKPADFDKTWDTYQQELKAAGVDKLGEEFTKLVKERVKFWSE